jgi:hypothetical protein
VNFVTRWFLHQWIKGRCFVCNERATTRFQTTQGPSIDLRACAKHEDDVRALTLARIREWAEQEAARDV